MVDIMLGIFYNLFFLFPLKYNIWAHRYYNIIIVELQGEVQ